jgi:hypothetical protein
MSLFGGFYWKFPVIEKPVVKPTKSDLAHLYNAYIHAHYNFRLLLIKFGIPHNKFAACIETLKFLMDHKPKPSDAEHREKSKYQHTSHEYFTAVFKELGLSFEQAKTTTNYSALHRECTELIAAYNLHWDRVMLEYGWKYFATIITKSKKTDNEMDLRLDMISLEDIVDTEIKFWKEVYKDKIEQEIARFELEKESLRVKRGNPYRK